MAVYKVIQDVEAEDKLIGFLSFKGLIYALIAGFCAFIEFRLFILGTPVKYLFIIAFGLPMILFSVLASPLGGDQPTEVWLLSRVRFFLKPRQRIWDQAGMEELVTVTAPTKVDLHLTKDLSQKEVHSRLRTLASTLDTRGWAIKNVDTNLNDLGLVHPTAAEPSDRLVANAGYTQEAPVVDIHAADDIMDEQNNPTAQKFAAMMQTADEQRKKSVLQTMKGLVSDSDSKPRPHIIPSKSHTQVHTRIHPFGNKEPVAPAKPAPVQKTAPAPVTPKQQAANMELAQSGSAFSVATLSQLANRHPQIEQSGPNEVTINLH